MQRWEIKAIGRVQGVGFRYFVWKLAKEYGINGYVRNLSDGSVFIIADSEKHVIDSFCEQLKSGNGHSRIDKLIIETMELTRLYNDFEIR